MAHVILENIGKSFGSVEAVKGMNLTIEDKEFAILVGPSGCGKSTALRMIAGLEDPSSGTIRIGDRQVNKLPPKDRDIAMVFQEYALYPHMSVYKNMAFGLRLRKYPKEEIDRRVFEAAEILSIQPLLDRKPRQLSGGQRQRVAVGRAIVRKPAVFLFDEPLSNLDAKLRVQMRVELSKLHERLKTTIVYVTHDQVEAMTMGSKIIVMKDGVIQQVGRPIEVYQYPDNMFVAGFIGSPVMNFFPSRLTAKNGHMVLDAGNFVVPISKDRARYYEPHLNSEVIMGIRPHDMVLRCSAPDSIQYSFIRAKVEVVEPLGSEIHLCAVCGEHTCVAVVGGDADICTNQELELCLNTGKMHLFEKDEPNNRIRVDR